MTAPAFGDTVTLVDGRVGVVTFAPGDGFVRFVQAGVPAQSWEWVADELIVGREGGVDHHQCVPTP